MDIDHDSPTIFRCVSLDDYEKTNSRPEEGATDDNGDTVSSALQRQELEGSNGRSSVIFQKRLRLRQENYNFCEARRINMERHI